MQSVSNDNVAAISETLSSDLQLELTIGLTGGSSLGGCEEHNQSQVLGNVLEAMAGHRGHINHGAAANRLNFIAYPNGGTSGGNIIDFILPVRLLLVFFTHAQLVDTDSQSRDPQELQVRPVQRCAAALDFVQVEDIHAQV